MKLTYVPMFSSHPSFGCIIVLIIKEAEVENISGKSKQTTKRSQNGPNQNYVYQRSSTSLGSQPGGNESSFQIGARACVHTNSSTYAGVTLVALFTHAQTGHAYPPGASGPVRACTNGPRTLARC